MNWALVSILVLTAAGAWWLSGYDTRVTGQDKRADLIRRLFRVVITLILVGFGAEHFLRGGIREAFISVLFTLPLAPFWVGCVAELFTRGFQGLVDSEDHRQYDAGQVPRDLDRLAALVRDGQNDDAIALCRQLSESNEVSTAAMEAMLFQIYQEQFSDERILHAPSLAEVHRLRGEKDFTGALARLEAILRKQPQHLAASLLRLRIHAEDLGRPDQARALLETLSRQPQVPPAFTPFARQRVDEWSGAVPRRAKSAVGVESLLVNRTASPPPAALDADTASVDELLAGGHLATAIETLEHKLRAEPQDFDSWLKLAEAHGVYCRDLSRAGKVIDRIAANPAFGPEQIQLAKARLKEWKAGQKHG